MPTNVSPEYKAAEASYRKTRDPRERLEWLREMLRAIPKHKGTDHLQGDIKRRIKELSEELEGPRKGGAHGAPAQVIRPEGAAQLALIGPPNSGKSALHVRLTGSAAHVGPYPFTTQHAEPGMMPWEDIHFQLVDLPAVSPQHPVPWLAGTLQMADACLLVIDLGDPACIEQAQAAHAILRDKRVTLSEHWPAGGTGEGPAPDEDDPFAIRLPTLVLANKADLIADAAAEIKAFFDLTGLRYPWLPVSAQTGGGLGELGPWLFRNLGVIRVYTKTPGKPLEKHHPFTLRRGQTIDDVARLVHADIARALKYARVWAPNAVGGLHVGRDHPLADGEIVELHM